MLLGINAPVPRGEWQRREAKLPNSSANLTGEITPSSLQMSGTGVGGGLNAGRAGLVSHRQMLKIRRERRAGRTGQPWCSASECTNGMFIGGVRRGSVPITGTTTIHLGDPRGFGHIVGHQDT